ncbi:MAG: TSUP family transporter [Proteobacteria bacterium]|nr:TSUP family transporter [Pseudomonadota bacterium]
MFAFDNFTVTVILSAVSFLAGFIDSIAGGGGLLLLPSLLIAGIPPQVALGTMKFASSIGTGTALVNFILKKKVVWKIAASGIAFSLLGSFIGTKTILIFNNETVGRIIIFLLPLAMLITLIPQKERAAENEPSRFDLTVKIPFICLLIGFYDGFFGPGTGSFLIIAFYIFIGLGLVQSSATAKVFNLASNLGALVIFILAGKVIYMLGIPLAVANILGNYLGSTLAVKKGAKTVKFFLLLSLSILMISLIWKYTVK